MSNLKIKELTTSSSLIPELADLYAACFGENDGWGERAACWKELCLDDGRGRIIPYVEVGTPCPKCATPMTEAYPRDWTIDYILGELSYPGALGLIGLIDNIAVAAAWAFEGSIESITTKKYTNADMSTKAVKAYQSIWQNNPWTRHVSEVFVGPEYRGQDIAQKLTNQLVMTSRLPITSRTLSTSPMSTVLEKAGLKQILKPGSDSDKPKRVFYIQPNK